MQSSIRQILQDKGGNAWSIPPDASVHDALKLMSEKDVGALLVMEGGKIVGVFSERDFARKVLIHGVEINKTKVSEMMSRTIYVIDPNKTMADCMAVMTQKRIRHLPVIENTKLIGIISIGDVVNQIIRDQKNEIDFLEDYITGGYHS
jgi:CBS domain-containing protein